MVLPLSFQQKLKSEEQLPGIVGNIEHYENFPSKFVDPHNIDVWLPPSYKKGEGKKYPVLYMHDGQNLFDPKISFIGVDWGIDETMTQLISENKIREAIVVGIWNTPKRRPEYMPLKAFKERYGEEGMKKFEEKNGSPIISDEYLKFIVKELKPFIDSTYTTLPDRDNTFIMGSSMGGLISLYAICEYPDVFGGAGCVSTHWPATEDGMIEYLKKSLPDTNTHKIYFDYGTETTDSQYEPYQKKADEVMKSAGYKEGKNWITKKFEGDEHSERAWRRRVHIPLVFLIGK